MLILGFVDLMRRHTGEYWSGRGIGLCSTLIGSGVIGQITRGKNGPKYGLGKFSDGRSLSLSHRLHLVKSKVSNMGLHICR